MQIIPAEQLPPALIQNFLSPHEKMCVQLSSYVRKNRGDIYAIKDNDEEICGVFYAKGTLLHCIPSFSAHAAELTQVLGNFLLTHPVKCVNGELTVSESLKALVQSTQASVPPAGHQPQTNRYKLMCLSPADQLTPPPEPLQPGDEIRRMANPEHDAEIIFDLQKHYIMEEVAPAGKNPGDLEINVILKQILKNQICLTLFSDGEPVAKANSNAIGWNCVQLGGIYTNPLYRRNGYACQLVYNLCSRILRTGRTVTLYVKEKNTPALELYKKLRFKECGSYSITYF
ncbi:putative acetyltransferase [Treponema sp. JC4]|uniref:GNAT family N-acetyltransferase n=1 Tax=Treponema sp. JC4 TaxID=1124982 RepID=UPI00025B0E17|nr:GNAT family N-acetyltransferase [Treponema sp. JC4]EID84917.1 putative acetyltransferase [Treponema sp. JC4]